MDTLRTGILFMIHGMWGGAWQWDNYKNFFETRNYRCLIPILRYHDMDPAGLPNPQLGTTSLLDYAEDLEKEIRSLEEKPIIMGHSMGGLLAQILASRGLARGLVLLAPGAPAGIMALKLSVLKSFRSALCKWGFWKKPMRQTFEEAAWSILHLLPVGEQRDTYRKFVYESGRAGFEMGFWFMDSKRAARVDESSITCPTLIVVGTEDRITPATVVRKVADKYNTVSAFMEFTCHAHWLIAEPGWDDIANHISNWLKRNIPKQSKMEGQ